MWHCPSCKRENEETNKECWYCRNERIIEAAVSSEIVEEKANSVLLKITSWFLKVAPWGFIGIIAAVFNKTEEFGSSTTVERSGLTVLQWYLIIFGFLGFSLLLAASVIFELCIDIKYGKSRIKD